VIVAVVAWGRFGGAVMAVVVNVGAVMGAGISADVTDVTVHHDHAQTLQVYIPREPRRRLSGWLFRQGARAWVKVSLTRRAQR
jgi:hypothetical protein